MTTARLCMRFAFAGMLLSQVACSEEHDSNSQATQTTPAGTDAEHVSSNAWFTDVARQSGINFTWHSGHSGRFLLPESIGGGCALFDFDNDGHLDIFLIQAGDVINHAANKTSRLYRNNGDGTFEDVTEGSGADVRGYGMGVACGDYDNDGNTDLFITGLGRNTLLRNDGNGRFTNISREAGIALSTIWSSSAAFVDIDADGHLDLFICNYANWSLASERDCFNDMGAPDYCDPANYDAPSVDTLYRNNGDGTFTDISISAGLEAHPGTGLGIACTDFNNDGRIDIFVANDGRPNALWINLGEGRFRNEAWERGCAVDEEGKAKAGMGVMAADVNDDGFFDIIVCNLRRESDSLFINSDGKFFVDGTAAAGLRAPTRRFTRFGLGLVDFDNDGLLDLFEAGGRVQRADFSHADDPYAEPNLLMKGVDNGRFEDIANAGTSTPFIHTSRGAAFGDFDGDGGVDIVVVNRDAPAYLLRNIVENRGNWIALRVLNAHGSDALGSVVTIRVGDRTITRIVQAAYSMNTSNDPSIHVGVGEMTSIDSVSVRWIDGRTQVFGPMDAGKVHVLKRD